MAEAVGLAASIVQVASTGLQCAETLYQYAESVNSADKRIAAIVQQVKLTSTVIKELQHVFETTSGTAHFSTDAVNTARDSLSQCNVLFMDLQGAVSKSNGRVGKLFFPFKEPKLEMYQTDLERLKSNLQLLISVLIHARTLTSDEDKATIRAQRDEISRLIGLRDQALKQYDVFKLTYGASGWQDNIATSTSSSRSAWPSTDVLMSPNMTNASGGLVRDSPRSYNAYKSPFPAKAFVPLNAQPTQPVVKSDRHTNQTTSRASSALAARTDVDNPTVDMSSRLAAHITLLRGYISHVEELQRELFKTDTRHQAHPVKLFHEVENHWKNLSIDGNQLYQIPMTSVQPNQQGKHMAHSDSHPQPAHAQQYPPLCSRSESIARFGRTYPTVLPQSRNRAYIERAAAVAKLREGTIDGLSDDDLRSLEKNAEEQEDLRLALNQTDPAAKAAAEAEFAKLLRPTVCLGDPVSSEGLRSSSHSSAPKGSLHVDEDGTNNIGGTRLYAPPRYRMSAEHATAYDLPEPRSKPAHLKLEVSRSSALTGKAADSQEDGARPCPPMYSKELNSLTYMTRQRSAEDVRKPESTKTQKSALKKQDPEGDDIERLLARWTTLYDD